MSYLIIIALICANVWQWRHHRKKVIEMHEEAVRIARQCYEQGFDKEPFLGAAQNVQPKHERQPLYIPACKL